MVYTSQVTAQQDLANGRPRLNNVDCVERLTGMKADKLAEVLQDREAWRELVVVRVDPQPPDYCREIEKSKCVQIQAER